MKSIYTKPNGRYLLINQIGLTFNLDSLPIIILPDENSNENGTKIDYPTLNKFLDDLIKKYDDDDSLPMLFLPLILSCVGSHFNLALKPKILPIDKKSKV